MGIPTVTVSSSEFVGLAKDTALGQGAADFSFVVVPHPMGMIPMAEIIKKAEAAFPEILRQPQNGNPNRNYRLMTPFIRRKD
jgi:hypothetical protein